MSAALVELRHEGSTGRRRVTDVPVCTETRQELHTNGTSMHSGDAMGARAEPQHSSAPQPSSGCLTDCIATDGSNMRSSARDSSAGRELELDARVGL